MFNEIEKKPETFKRELVLSWMIDMGHQTGVVVSRKNIKKFDFYFLVLYA